MNKAHVVTTIDSVVDMHLYKIGPDLHSFDLPYFVIEHIPQYHY